MARSPGAHVVELRRRIARSSAHLRLRDLVLHIGRNNLEVLREDLARRYLKGEGIEIGAASLPLRLPPSVRVRYVDNLDRDALIAQSGDGFLGSGIEVAAIPRTDVIDDAQTLAAFADGSVDFIIACHVVEHLEDPIGALENFARITRRDGIIFVILPDARHTFDYLRERTTIEHLLRDHQEGPHTSRMHHYAEWAEYIEGIGPPGIPRRSAEYAAANAHHHFHVWELEGFVGLLGAIDLDCELVHAQHHKHEFAVILRKT
ncbi:MAG TPA: methyltransferase domain-containing protein [Solirubrobacteraceae bacterium]|jgi:predicted SAM-dependent methyltransferase